MVQLGVSVSGRAFDRSQLYQKLKQSAAASRRQVYQRAGVGFGRTDKPNRALDGTPKDSIKRRKLRRGKQTVAEAEEEASGPRGLLLVGFSEEDTQRVRQWFATMEAGFPVSSCTDQLLGGTLKEAVTNLDGSFRCIQGWEKPQEKVPRAAFFSGMSNNETMGLAQYWESTGMQTPIFASVVGAAENKPLRAVLLEIAQAYAASKAAPEDKLDSESLRVLLKERMAAKRRESKEQGSRSGPIVISPKAEN